MNESPFENIDINVRCWYFFLSCSKFTISFSCDSCSLNSGFLVHNLQFGCGYGRFKDQLQLKSWIHFNWYFLCFSLLETPSWTHGFYKSREVLCDAWNGFLLLSPFPCAVTSLVMSSIPWIVETQDPNIISIISPIRSGELSSFLDAQDVRKNKRNRQVHRCVTDKNP